MQVPQLQFAQVPVMQLPSEMQGFSNALLQAGQMRQNRLQQAEALARQQEQQQFENQMATQRMGLAEREFESGERLRGQQEQINQAQIDAIASEQSFTDFIKTIPPEISELSKTDPIAGMQQTIELAKQAPGVSYKAIQMLESELKGYQQQQAAAQQQQFENKLSLDKYDLEKQKLGLMQQEASAQQQAAAQQQFENRLSLGKFDLEKQKLVLMQQEASAQQQANALKQQADQRDLLLKGFENEDKKLEFNYTNLKQQQATLVSRENHLQDLYNKAKAGSLTPTEKEVISSQFNFVFGDNNKPEYNKQLMGLIEPELNRIKAEKMRIESQAINVIGQRNKLSATLNQLRGMPNLGVAFEAPYQAPGVSTLMENPLVQGVRGVIGDVNTALNQQRQIQKSTDKASQRSVIDTALNISKEQPEAQKPADTGAKQGMSLAETSAKAHQDFVANRPRTTGEVNKRLDMMFPVPGIRDILPGVMVKAWDYQTKKRK